MHRTSQTRPPHGQTHPSQLSATTFVPGGKLATVTSSAMRHDEPCGRTTPGGGA
jgi:hypothetical protein